MKKLLLAVMLLFFAAQAQAEERRIALVIGNANYQSGALPTPANDAGLVAQTLQAAGFDVSGARDLDQESLRRAFRDFVDKAGSATPADTVAYIYLSGYGLQLEGENYFAPVDARIATDANVSSESLRLSDYLKPLSALHLKSTIVVLDLARANPFAKNGNPLPSGLALVDAEPNTLIAFNAAPGTVAPNEAGPYSAYAQALAEISREGGVGIDETFTRVRLRVNQLTEGAEVPWQSSKLEQPFYLFERAPDAPPPAVSAEQTSSIRTKPIREFDARDAYLAALDRDTLDGYLDFVAAYPNDPMAPRVRAIIAARREAITWRRTRNIDTPRAYWSYLRRYPRGAHSHDARRRLRELAAAFEPPPTFEVIEYDVPPPLPDEIIYVERPVLVFDDPDFDFVPPPPPPVIFLPPPPIYFIDLPPPPPPIIAFVLPMPVYRPVPIWIAPPRYIVPPPTNVIYNNIHNTVVINNTTNMVTITSPQGQSRTVTPAAAVAPASGPGVTAPNAPTTSPSRTGIVAGGIAAAGAAVALAPTLPKSLTQKASTTPNPAPAPLAKPLAPGRVLRVQSTAPAAQPNQAAPGATPPPGSPTPATRTGAPGAGAVTSPPTQQSKPQIGQPLPGAPGAQALPPSSSRPGRPGSTAPKSAQPSGTPTSSPSGTQTSPPRTPERPATRPSPTTSPGPKQLQPSSPAATPPRQAIPERRSTVPSRAPERPRVAPPPHTAPASPPVTHAPAPPRHTPPPAISRPAPPPVSRPAPPPQVHPAAPPRPAPPPPAMARPAPPPVARPAPPPPRPAAPPAAKPAQKCVQPNGQPCR